MAQLEYAAKNLLEVQSKIVKKLNQTIEKIERHHRGCNISNTVGVSVGVIGTVALIAAPFTGGASVFVHVAAVGGMLGSTALTVRTSVRDIIISKDFIKEVNQLVQSQEKAAKKFKTLIENTKSVVMSYKDITGCPEEKAWRLVLKASCRIGKDIMTMISRIRGAMGAARAIEFAKDVAAMEKAGCSIGVEVVTHIPVGASTKGVEAVERVSAKIGTEAASKTGKVAMTKAAGEILAVVGCVVEIGLVIYGWANEHPTLKGIRDARGRLQDSIQQLEKFLCALSGVTID